MADVQRPAEPAEHSAQLPGATGPTVESADLHTPPSEPPLPSDSAAASVLGVVGTLKAGKKLKTVAAKRWRRASLTMAMLGSKDALGRVRRRSTIAPGLWKEFLRLDKKNEGCLDTTMLSTLVKRLDLKLTRKQLNDATLALDPERTGKISLGRLDEWYYYTRRASQQMLRQEMKAIFDNYSPNPHAAGGSVVERDVFTAMMERHGAKFNIPNFDPQQDFPVADQHGRVAFPQFELWWKKKTGVHMHTTDVLPEFLRMRLDEEGYSAQKQESSLWRSIGSVGTTDKRSARFLWKLVRMKVRTIIRMGTVWGKLEEVYDTNQSSAYGHAPLDRLIVDPEGNFAQLWDLAGVLMLLYVIVAVPLTVSFAVEVELWSAYFYIDMIVDVYYIVDIFLNFRTAFITKSGRREGRPIEIARNYTKGWFIIDLVSSVPVQYFGYMVRGDTATPDNVKILKSIRLLRLTKMLRIARLRKFIHKYFEDVKTAQWLPAVTMLFVILFLCHILSCVWYMAGGATQTLGNGRLIAGWVIQEPDWYSEEDYLSDACVSDTSCLHQLDLQLKNISLGTRYSTSLYYVFNSLEHGFTNTEKIVAVVSELTLGLIYGMLAGLMSSILIVMGSGEAELQAKVVRLRHWMNNHHMPKEFQQGALEYFHRVWETKLPMQLEEEMQVALPPSMNLYMKQHMYGAALRQVPLFRSLGEDIFAELCQRARPQLCLPGQYVMKCGDIGTDFFVLLSGELKVSEADPGSPDGLRFLGYLGEGAFFGEVPLLENYASGSEIRRRTIMSEIESRLCYITRDTILDLRIRFPELDARLRRFKLVGTKPSKVLRHLAKRHKLGQDYIRELQYMTKVNCDARSEGAIGMKYGDGHRTTRYVYQSVTDWTIDRPISGQQDATLIPGPPTSGNPMSGRVRGSARENSIFRSDSRVPEVTDGARRLHELPAQVEALCADNSEELNVRKSSIWIKYNQGFRAGEWREVFPYSHDHGSADESSKPVFFLALETEQYEKSTAANNVSKGVRTVHVSGLQAISTADNIEDEQRLATAFGHFGRVIAATLRYRRNDDGVSWALVTFETAEAARKAVSSQDSRLVQQLSKQRIWLTMLDIGKAMASEGSMREVAATHADKVRSYQKPTRENEGDGGVVADSNWQANEKLGQTRVQTGPELLKPDQAAPDDYGSGTDRARDHAAAGDLAVQLADIAKRVEENERTAAEHRARIEAALDILLQDREKDIASVGDAG